MEYYRPNCNKFDLIELNKNSSPRILFIAGTHGDEPAGYHTLNNYDFSNTNKNILVIPNVNQCGTNQNMRINPITRKDINREYGKNNIYNSQIESIILTCDLIIDFHEGYDYHLRNSNSIGATLSSLTEGKLCEYIIGKLNEGIKEDYKKFSYIGEKEEIVGSLRYFSDNNNIPHILVETTRIEPLEERVKKCEIIIKSILESNI